MASTLRANGWRVKTLVCDPNTHKVKVIAAQGIEIVRGDLVYTQSLQAGMAGPTVCSAFNQALVKGQHIV